MTSARVGRAERRDRLAPVARMRGADVVEEHGEPRAIAARRVICGGGVHFWQNGERCRCGTHRARILACAAVAMAVRPRRPRRVSAGGMSRTTPPGISIATMLSAEPKLELRSRLPSRANGRKPPLLFVHGGYSDSWCWDAFFLPWFARQGYAAHAVSLRGHGGSAGAEMLFIAGLDDYAADVERAVAQLPSPPVLIGHSMGAAVVERLLVDAPGARRGAARPGAARRIADDRREARHRAARLPAVDDAPRRDEALAPRPRHVAPVSISATTWRPRFSPRPRIIWARSRRARCSTCRCGCTGSCPSGTACRCWCWAPKATASRRPTMSRPPHATTASRP